MGRDPVDDRTPLERICDDWLQRQDYWQQAEGPWEACGWGSDVATDFSYWMLEQSGWQDPRHPLHGLLEDFEDWMRDGLGDFLAARGPWIHYPEEATCDDLRS